MSTSLDNLIGMRTQLECILQHAPRFGSLIDRPPILDSHTHATSTANPRSDSNQPITNKNSAANTSGIPGLKAFQEYVRRDVEQIDLVSHVFVLEICNPSVSSLNHIISHQLILSHKN